MARLRIDKQISELIDYAKSKELISEYDVAYATGRVMERLSVGDFIPEEIAEKRELHEILGELTDYACEEGLLEGDTVVYRDLFDTALMGELTPRPSAVIEKFRELYERSPKEATDYFYRLAEDSNYIRSHRIKRDVRWSADTEYGEIDISINLSKPEKDPKAIAAAKLLPPSGYPKCLLCHENEGYAGSIAKPARQNLRQIPFDMGGERWFLQYSPYVYYNEHCIALSEKHTPMKIDKTTFGKLLGFITEFPHYFIGSNADLPIVGGSILSHDHMQGGRYTFAMERAPIKQELSFEGFPTVRAGIVKWPISVIRLTSPDKAALIELSSKILDTWRKYSDPEAGIFAETDGEPHNTITPIARRRGEDFEIDLALRNNITSEEHPLGVFHPHKERHNVKKENIGLVEVMGLAVLPARLKAEMEKMREAILEGKDFSEIPEIEKHREWFLAFRDRYDFREDTVDGILRREIANTFALCLRDAGVFKDTREGEEAFLRFIGAI